HIGRITPIYPLTEGVAQRWLRGLIWRALETHGAAVGEPAPEFAAAIKATGFLSRAEAVRRLHFPDDLDEPEGARRRLALDEFIEFQQRIQSRRRNFESKAPSLPCRGDNRLVKPFLAKLGFRLTAAQTRVLRELRAA